MLAEHIKMYKQWLVQDAEHELEATTQLHKLCSQYESKIEK
jgi:hypothetical protein